jgi:exoribonuclease-2
MKPTKDSLVLYKQTPALVNAAGDKLDILLPGGKTRSVREKDIFPLHPGPVPRFPELEKGAPEGQPEEAWELLQGESPSLQELAELVYGEYSPSTSWLAFKLLNRSPWFRGTPDAIEVADTETVTARIKSDQEKANAEQRWEDFLGRFQQGNIDREADEPYLRDLEMYALGRSKGSRILKAIGKTQSPENAHRIMIAKGVKDPEWNPHPLRLDVPLGIPDYSLGEMSGDDERLNLTGIEAFAIDDEGNQDPDDAVAWDGTRFWVHVADVSGLIPVGSDADEDARERAGLQPGRQLARRRHDRSRKHSPPGR